MIFQKVSYLSKHQAVAHLLVCLPALGVLIDDEFNGEFDHVEVTNPDGNGQQAVIFVISDKFKGMPTVRRHMQINTILKEEIK